MIQTAKKIFKKIQKQSLLVQTFLYLIIYLALRTIMEMIGWSVWKIQTYENFGNKGESFVLFHWDKCGHCKKMMPEWNAFAQKYNGDIKIKKVEQSEDPELIKKLNISSFPTILLLDKNNNKVKDYNGSRTTKGFQDFLAQN